MCSTNPKTQNNFPADLQHRDWLIKSTLKLIQEIDTNIRFKIHSPTLTQKVLIISNISEGTLEKLKFLANTDANNNYGYLEHISVYLANDVDTLNIPVPGLIENSKNAWEKADILAFEAGNKNMFPFLNPFLDPVTKTPISIPRYVDIMTSMIPWSTKTFGKAKIFRIIFNPDYCTTVTCLETLQWCDGSACIG